VKILLSCLVLSAAIVGGCRSESSRSAAVTPVEELPMNCFRQQWYRDLHLDREKVKAMYLNGDELFVHSGYNRFYSLSLMSGDLKFAMDIADMNTDVKPPLLQKDHIVVAAGKDLKFYDRRGRLERSLDLFEPVHSSLAGDDKMLYMGQDHYAGRGHPGAGRLIAVDPTFQYNPVRWQLETGGGVPGKPVVAGTSVFFGGLDGNVYALDVDRRQVWSQLPEGKFKTDGQIFADLRVSGNELIVACMDTKLYSLDIRTGKLRWSCLTGTPLRSSPEVTGGFVYQYALGKGVMAISRAEGEPMNRPVKWTVAEATQFLAEDTQYVYLRSKDNRVLAVDKANGNVKFQSTRKDLAVFASNTKDATIYASTKEGLVLAIKPVLKPGTVGQLALDVRPLGFQR